MVAACWRLFRGSFCIALALKVATSPPGPTECDWHTRDGSQWRRWPQRRRRRARAARRRRRQAATRGDGSNLLSAAGRRASAPAAPCRRVLRCCRVQTGCSARAFQRFGHARAEAPVARAWFHRALESAAAGTGDQWCRHPAVAHDAVVDRRRRLVPNHRSPPAMEPGAVRRWADRPVLRPDSARQTRRPGCLRSGVVGANLAGSQTSLVANLGGSEPRWFAQPGWLAAGRGLREGLVSTRSSQVSN